MDSSNNIIMLYFCPAIVVNKSEHKVIEIAMGQSQAKVNIQLYAHDYYSVII